MTDGGQLMLQADQNDSPPFGPANGSAALSQLESDHQTIKHLVSYSRRVGNEKLDLAATREMVKLQQAIYYLKKKSRQNEPSSPTAGKKP